LLQVKESLLQLRLAKATSGAPAKLGEIKQTRRNVARLLTVMRQRLRESLKAKYAKSKFMPLDLRPHTTKKMRRNAKLAKRPRLTLRQKKQKRAFPVSCPPASARFLHVAFLPVVHVASVVVAIVVAVACCSHPSTLVCL
jgi:large subunit ribosomal protein L35e